MAVTSLLSIDRDTGQVLTDTATLVGPALRAAVERFPDPLRRIAGYHLGWLDSDGGPAARGAGKLVRPALVVRSALAVGGPAADAVPAAVAVQLVHDFSLLHDDVMDGDRVRRHRPAAWTVFGVPAAILGGDALLAGAFRVLAESEHLPGGQGIDVLSAAVRDLIDGQCADLDFETRARVSVAECVTMAEGKTGALLGCCCALGALAGGDGEQVDRLRGFGARVGLAFQFVDDILGIWGDPAVTGKPAGSDLANRKMSLPVVFALASGTDAGARLADLYRPACPLSPDQVACATHLVETAGGRDWAQDQADTLLAQAIAQLDGLRSDRPAVGDLIALAGLLARRDR